MQIFLCEILISVFKIELCIRLYFRNPVFHKPIYNCLIGEKGMNPSVPFSKDLALVFLLILDLETY